MTLKKVVISYDTVAALAAWKLCDMVITSPVANSVAASIYSAGISALSIIFSVFFAALAIILAASDDSFVAFLEETGLYTRLIQSFRFTLGSLFFALVIAILAFVWATVRPTAEVQPLWRLEVFSFTSTYALFATFLATMDATTYCVKRAQFLRWKPKPGTQPQQAATNTAPVLASPGPAASSKSIPAPQPQSAVTTTAPQRKQPSKGRKGRA